MLQGYQIIISLRTSIYYKTHHHESAIIVPFRIKVVFILPELANPSE